MVRDLLIFHRLLAGARAGNDFPGATTFSNLNRTPNRPDVPSGIRPAVNRPGSTCRSGFHRPEVHAGKHPVITVGENPLRRPGRPFLQNFPFLLRLEVPAGFRPGSLTPVDHGAFGGLNEQAAAIGRDDCPDTQRRNRCGFAEPDPAPGGTRQARRPPGRSVPAAGLRRPGPTTSRSGPADCPARIVPGP